MCVSVCECEGGVCVCDCARGRGVCVSLGVREGCVCVCVRERGVCVSLGVSVRLCEREGRVCL